MIVHSFYNGIMHAIRSLIDVGVGGTLMSKIEDEAYNLIKLMALNHYQRPNKWGQPKRVRGKFDFDALTLLITKMDVMT